MNSFGAFVAWALGHAAPPDAPPDDHEEIRRAAIERALVVDDWLIYCAQDRICQFDWWWSVALFHESVVKRFIRDNPEEKPPLRDETGKVLLGIIRRDGNRLVIENHKLVSNQMIHCRR